MFKHKIGIFGVPRSGTSWLSQIFNSHPDIALRFQPLFSYGHQGKLTESSTHDEINSFFDEILHSKDSFALMQSETHKDYPVFSKSSDPRYIVFKETRYLNLIHNILDQCSMIKIIGIVRNPLATLASWTKAPNEFQSDWDILAEWLNAPSKNQDKVEEFYGFKKWKQNTNNFLNYQRKYPDQFMLIRYEELRENPIKVTGEIFRFCDIDFHGRVEDFIRESQSKHDLDPYSVFRNKTTGDDWENILPTEISDCIISELNNTPLSIFLDQ